MKFLKLLKNCYQIRSHCEPVQKEDNSSIQQCYREEYLSILSTIIFLCLYLSIWAIICIIISWIKFINIDHFFDNIKIIIKVNFREHTYLFYRICVFQQQQIIVFKQSQFGLKPVAKKSYYKNILWFLVDTWHITDKGST